MKNSLLRESIRKHLLLEQLIADVVANIDIEFRISKHDTGVHLNRRQSRHDDYIYLENIERLVTSALDEVATQIVSHNIRNKKRFAISRQGGDFLNVIIEPTVRGLNSWNLAVVTVMKKEDFSLQPGQMRIVVPSTEEDEDYY
jgi:hypothetical protein